MNSKFLIYTFAILNLMVGEDRKITNKDMMQRLIDNRTTKGDIDYMEQLVFDMTINQTLNEFIMCGCLDELRRLRNRKRKCKC